MHAKNLLGVGRRVMIQRYLRQVDTAGETALVFFDGEFSHAVRKGPILDGPFRAEDNELCRPRGDEPPRGHRTPSARSPSASSPRCPQLAPGVDKPLLYARVDLIPDDEGNPVVLELELDRAVALLRARARARSRGSPTRSPRGSDRHAEPDTTKGADPRIGALRLMG